MVEVGSVLFVENDLRITLLSLCEVAFPFVRDRLYPAFSSQLQRKETEGGFGGRGIEGLVLVWLM